MMKADIIHVARYEIKIQSRDWLFRILSVLALGGITFFQFFLQSNEVTPRWSMIALPCSIPFVNAYMFNIVQSFVLIFISTGTFTRERRIGELESIHVRPFENGDYLIGKFLGILLIFLFFNVVSIGLGCLLNMIYSFAPFNPLYYLFYLFTLTLPTLVFLSGVGFCLSGMISYRYFPPFVLFLLLCFSLGWAPDVCHGTFDFLGNSLANVFSDVSGHVNLFFYLSQRLMYFLLGVGFLFLSTRFFHRLPNRNRSIARQSACGCLLILSGIGVGVLVESFYARDEKVRDSYRVSFERHWQVATCRVREHDILLEQEGKFLRVRSDMKIYNPDTVTLPNLMLFLNPGLQVHEIRIRGRVLSWERDNQVVRVAYPLAGLDSVTLNIACEGVIDDRFCELRLSEKERLNTGRGEFFFNFGRRNSLVDDDYLLLPPGCGWYPVAIPPENPLLPASPSRDFTRFRLKVAHPRQKVVLAPGVPLARKGQDTLYFTPSRRLSGMTVCGGDYKLKTVACDHVVLFFYYMNGHESLVRLFPRVQDQWVRDNIQQGLREICYERGLAEEGDRMLLNREWCEPGLRRLMVVESPLVFDPGWQSWKWGSERVQPGIVLVPERGIGLPVTHRGLAARKRYPLGEESLDKSTLYGVMRSFFLPYRVIPASNPFYRVLVKSRDGIETMEKSLENTCYVYPLVFEPELCVYSPEYPLLDIALKTLWRGKGEFLDGYIEKRGNYAKDAGAFSGIPGDGGRDRVSARFLLQGHRFEEVSRDKGLSGEALKEVLHVKSEELLYRLMVSCSRGEVFHFLEGFYGRYRGEVPFEVLAREARDSLGVDLKAVVAAWSDSRHDSRFKIKEASSVRFGDYMHRFCFKIFNDSDSPGLVIARMGIEGMNDGQFFQPFLLEGRQAKEVSVVKKKYEPSDCQVVVGNSMHVPSEFTIKTLFREGNSGLLSSVSIIDTDTSSFAPPVNEYVVDDEDEGFRVIESKITWLQGLWKERAVEGNRWTKSLNGRSYGKLIRGYHSKKGKDGRAKAEWTVDLPEAGRYEVMALVYHNQSYSRGELREWANLLYPPRWIKDSLKYHYIVEHGGERTVVKIETITSQEDVAGDQFQMEKNAKGGFINIPDMRKYFYISWESLGVYDFPKGKAAVTLSDVGSPEDMIIADAVKWVKVEGR